MNKLIYAIGIAIAATFASNTKIEHHQNKQATDPVEQVSTTRLVASPDSIKMEDAVVLH